MNRIFVLLMTIAMLTLGIAIQPARAGDSAFHEESESYRVYLGIVPASFLKRNPSLVDQDKQLHGGVSEQPPTMQHVMVTVFRKDNNARVLNATVISRVGIKKFFGGTKMEKPLEKMLTSGVVAYGNYFAMPENGEYEIAVRIYEPNKDKNETVTFVYKKL